MKPNRKIDPTKDYSVFERHLVTFESVPSVDAGLMPDIHEKDLAVKSRFNDISLEILTDSQGRDVIGTAVNADYQQKRESHFGTFEGAQSPTNIFQMAQSFKDESLATTTEMDCYCAVLGAAFEQDAVPYMKAERHDHSNKDLHFGLQLTFEHSIDESRFKELASLFEGYAYGVEFTVVDDKSIRAVNFRGDDGLPFAMSDVEFIGKVLRVAEKFPSQEEVEVSRMRVSGNYIFNDWNENPNGEGYLQILKDNGREDLVILAQDLRGKFLEKVKYFAAEMDMPEKTQKRDNFDSMQLSY